MKGLVLVLLAAGCTALLPLGNKRVGQEPPGYTITNFTCYVDNFGFDQRVFNMRVFTNAQNWVLGGPILFYTGNEGPIETFIDASGNLPVMAKSLGALLVFAEHRYFGDSMPFGANSFNSQAQSKYLSPHQALADYARYIASLKINPAYTQSAVIVVGGSYGGMLSAWFRIKYPHLVDGALAASAPIFHFPGTVDPELFNFIVTEDYKNIDVNCPINAYAGFQALNNNAYNSQYYFTFQSIFKTCQLIKSYNDVQNLINYVNSALVYMAMTDYPYPTNFLNPMPAFPVDVGCDMLMLVSNLNNVTQVLTALYDASNVYYNFSNNLPCNDITGSGSSSLGDNGWNYLSCSTLILPMAQDGMTNDMFLPQPWDYNAYAQSCEQAYGRNPQPLYARTYFGTSVTPYTSLRYISNIIFSSGSLDPWQSGAVTGATSFPITTITIDGGAHHLDLRAPDAADPQSVIDARATELATIRQYISTVPS